MRPDKDQESQFSFGFKQKANSPNPNQQAFHNIEDQNSQSFNFLSQPYLLKLKNLTNYSSFYNHQPTNQVQILLNRIEQLEDKVQALEKRLRNNKKTKRIRRKSEQILKKHQCEVCLKKYGSLVSLNLHLRLKHPEIAIAQGITDGKSNSEKKENHEEENNLGA